MIISTCATRSTDDHFYLFTAFLNLRFAQFRMTLSLATIVGNITPSNNCVLGKSDCHPERSEAEIQDRVAQVEILLFW